MREINIEAYLKKEKIKKENTGRIGIIKIKIGKTKKSQYNNE